MIWFYIVLFVLSFIYVVLDILEMRQENKNNFYLHNSNQVDKWILLLDKTHMIRVKGDFFGTYSKKEPLPYALYCGTACLCRFETEDYVRAMLVELSHFMSDENWHVFTI